MSNLTQFAGGAIKSLQRGTLALAGGSVNATTTVTSVDTTKSILTLLGSVTLCTDFASVNADITLTNATTITATRGASTSATTLRWQLVEYY